MKEKILVVGSSLKDKGGIVTVMNNIGNSFIGKEFHLDMVETYITGSKWARLKIFLKGFFHFWVKLKKNKPNLVHIHMSYKGSFYRKSLFVLTSKLFGLPTIVHVHGSSFKDFYSSLSLPHKKYVNYILNKTDKLIVLSEEWKKFFSAIVEKNKLQVLYNGVKISNYQLNKTNQIPVCLFLGRLGKRKGTYDLIEAVKIIKNKGIKAKFLLAGDGEIEKVKELIQTSYLSDYVETLGWISGEQKIKLLEDSDLFVLPSYNEGLPMAILEAMDYGLPIISTPVGGIPEVVENGVNGFLVKPGDISKLADALEKLICNYELRVEMGMRNQKKIREQFDLDVLLKDLAQLYKDLVRKGKLGDSVESK
jgi:glycosyltransferase involved in cell wall biosynthesis